MRSIDEVKAKCNQFYSELDQDEDDKEVRAIIDALNWVLGDSDELDNYLSL